jgi:hypothetical protein
MLSMNNFQISSIKSKMPPKPTWSAIDNSEETFESFFSAMDQESSSASKIYDAAAIGTLLDDYELLPRKPTSTNIFEFWCSPKFPQLKVPAHNLLSVSATQVSVERLFSLLSFIYNYERTRLNSDLLEDVMLLKANHHFDKNK